MVTDTSPITIALAARAEGVRAYRRGDIRRVPYLWNDRCDRHWLAGYDGRDFTEPKRRAATTTAGPS